MMKLSEYEKETNINFNEGAGTASIDTFNADLKRRLVELNRCRQDRILPETFLHGT